MATTNPPETFITLLSRVTPREIFTVLRYMKDANRRGLGEVLAGSYRRNTTIDNSAAAAATVHVHPYPCTIDSVALDGGPGLGIQPDPNTAPGATECHINYNGLPDTDPNGPVEAGVPVITFQAPTQIYHVTESAQPLPARFISRLNRYWHQLLQEGE